MNRDVSLSAWGQIDEICDQFERSWRSGCRPRIEDYLAAHTDVSTSGLLAELLRLEWALLVATDRRPDAATFVHRFPDFEQVVREALADAAEHDKTCAADALVPAVAPEPVPKQIGRYPIVGLLSKGSFGKVYLGHDDKLNRVVAIKVPLGSTELAAREFASYLLEARTLAELDHPNIVPVYDLGSTDDYACFIVCKYIDGTSLKEKLQHDRLSVKESVNLVATVAEALHFAHSKKVIHRDIKPSNILLDASGTPYVSDFGLALKEDHFGKFTGVMGTPAYMSPEQARGEGHLVDGRSDIFSLGVVLFELLTGQRPFIGSDSSMVIDHILSADARSPRQLDSTIPRELERICLRALSRRASDRYPSCFDFAEDLQQWLLTARADGVATPSLPANPQPPQEAAAVGIVPKGLRCFDREDADFFLSLVPGPRDRNGLPNCIRQWKRWVEQDSSDDSKRVGVIYGPSGCGKSSLVRAGLLPRLDQCVLPILVEASMHGTEDRILKQLNERLPGQQQGLTLSSVLTSIRRGAELRRGNRLLIVIDQFEQWLHGQADYEQTELLRALRQCDGTRVQCLLLVRDDFFLALSRFMSLLEIPLVQDQNLTLVDLFDPQHAGKVLLMFGRAYERLPASANLTPSQQQFLGTAVASLASSGRIFPVRLSLLTEMIKGRPWTPDTLTQLGGMDGIGTVFLEEAFSGEHAPKSQRIHEKAARAVLASLLPESGTEMKVPRRTRGSIVKCVRIRGSPNGRAASIARQRTATDFSHGVDQWTVDRA